ncbi:sodium/hydrogen exchanger 7 [Lepeophtheirus salmonis]|uniref:sodium/hydrogen exchanger 7 n=1 Tax=Lepeophtheirus salmonis TaxID=72036 RepID=UPI001AE2FB4C|nr:sodium/hydrogen exchanger 7-like [Lepeophtheirus salmonis]
MSSAEDFTDAASETKIDERKSLLHKLDSLILLLYTCLLTLTVVTIWLFKHRRIRFVHETGLAIVYGLVVGAAVRYGVTQDTKSFVEVVTKNVSGDWPRWPPDYLLLDSKDKNQSIEKTIAYSYKGEFSHSSEIDQKTTFDPEIFFNILLPPIIFHAGYSMKKQFFFRNIGSILTLAFIGTTLSTFVTAGILYGIVKILPNLEFFRFIDTLHFGALISATDPITILAVFNDVKVDVNFYALVFGESILNDAVAIVISRTVEDYESALTYGTDTSLNAMLFLKAVGDFLGIFGASFLVGSLMGCTTALLTKFTHIHRFPELESTLFVLMSYSTFLVAEVLNLTGIVAVLFCGICQAHYTYNNLSSESKHITKQFFNLLNFMAENFIFSYIGVSMFTFANHNFNIGFIVGSFFAIFIARAINVYILSFFLNLVRQNRITMNLQHMLFLSGLRGAIAFALAIRNTLSESRQMILTTTLIIVIVTVIVNGGSTMSLVTWLGIPLSSENNENDAQEEEPITSPNKDYNSLERPSETGRILPASWMARMWSKLDNRYLKPFLTHSNPTLMETLPECCLPIGKYLTSVEQLSRHPAMRAASMEQDNSTNTVTEAPKNSAGFSSLVGRSPGRKPDEPKEFENRLSSSNI